MIIDTEIQNALTNLTKISRNEGYTASELDVLRNNGERLVELYRENGLVASLFNHVLMNSEVAHFFCCMLKEVKDLWNIEEIQQTFAEALRNGDTLLIDAINFVLFYRKIPLIQEAIAYNIATCPSMLFQIHVATYLGLGEHPSVKQAILKRRPDIRKQVSENWHDGVFALWTPYLRDDEDIMRILKEAKPLILEEIRERDSMVDVSILLMQLEWVREDPEIVEAIKNRIMKTSMNNNLLLGKLRECDMFTRYPQLIDGLSGYRKEYRDWILGVS